MTDYIDREEALRHRILLYDLDGMIGYFAVKTNDIRKIPAADAAPVIRGRWLTWDEKFPDKVNGKNLGVFCSECENHADYSSPYCPHCGARMDEEDEQ